MPKQVLSQQFLSQLSIAQIVAKLHVQFAVKTTRLSVAESCTGGGISRVITDRNGSSNWFDRGYVTYSNQAKEDLLSVKKITLDSFGAVSQEVAIEMAEGCLINSGCDYALSVTGIAGPGGGSLAKPVGTIWFAWAGYGEDKQQLVVKSQLQKFDGDRQKIRQLAVHFSLAQLLAFIV